MVVETNANTVNPTREEEKALISTEDEQAIAKGNRCDDELENEQNIMEISAAVEKILLSVGEDPTHIANCIKFLHLGETALLSSMFDQVMLGAEKLGVSTITSCKLETFKDDGKTREEVW